MFFRNACFYRRSSYLNQPSDEIDIRTSFRARSRPLQELFGNVWRNGVVSRAREINEMEPEDLKEFLSDTSERYLVLAFRGEQCTSCRWQLYYPNLLTYYFEKENDVRV